MSWYKKALTNKRREVVSSVVFVVLFGLVITIWHYATGQSFEWHTISPIEEPGLLPRLFYSALVYVTLGAFLYEFGFYKALYALYRGTRGGYRAYKEMKALIWLGLILGMYFIIVPFVIRLLNAVISFFYNLFALILYLSPPFGIAVLIFGAWYYWISVKGKIK